MKKIRKKKKEKTPEEIWREIMNDRLYEIEETLYTEMKNVSDCVGSAAYKMDFTVLGENLKAASQSLDPGAAVDKVRKKVSEIEEWFVKEFNANLAVAPKELPGLKHIGLMNRQEIDEATAGKEVYYAELQAAVIYYKKAALDLAEFFLKRGNIMSKMTEFMAQETKKGKIVSGAALSRKFGKSMEAEGPTMEEIEGDKLKFDIFDAAASRLMEIMSDFLNQLDERLITLWNTRLEPCVD